MFLMEKRISLENKTFDNNILKKNILYKYKIKISEDMKHFYIFLRNT